MWNPFRTPVGVASSGFASQTYGGSSPDMSFDFPSRVVLTDNTIPDANPGPNETPIAYVGAVAPRFQDTIDPDYAGVNVLHTGEDNPLPGIQPYYHELTPALGSGSLIAPRDVGGYPGNARLHYVDRGPVTGNSNNFTGERGPLYNEQPGVYGPVTGDGEGYEKGVSAAYWQTQAKQLSDRARVSALVSAI